MYSTDASQQVHDRLGGTEIFRNKLPSYKIPLFFSTIFESFSTRCYIRSLKEEKASHHSVSMFQGIEELPWFSFPR